ncbi:MAG: biotin transporter BioY [Myxococcota bacterium]
MAWAHAPWHVEIVAEDTNAPHWTSSPERVPRWQMSALVALAVATLALASQIAIPIGPVPISAQTLIVFWLGASLKVWLSGLSVTLWLGLGALGWPVFAESTGGLEVLVGPSGGYLFAFLPAVVGLGWLARRGVFDSFWAAASAFTAATGMVLLFGAAWLALSIGTLDAWRHGVVPFLPGALLKIAVGAALVRPIRATLHAFGEP